MLIHLRLITFHTLAWTCTQRPRKGTRTGKGEITSNRWTNRSNNIGDKGVSRKGCRSRRIGSGNGSKNACATRAREGDGRQLPSQGMPEADERLHERVGGVFQTWCKWKLRAHAEHGMSTQMPATLGKTLSKPHGTARLMSGGPLALKSKPPGLFES